MQTARLIFSLFIATALAAAAFAADNNKTYATPDEAKTDPDFAVQGEYVGEYTEDNQTQKVGVQIIALGDGRFHGRAYPGGLPGDGWNGEKGHEGDGQRGDDGAVVLKDSENHKAVIKDGVATFYNPDGKKFGEAKKVERKSPTLGAKPPAGAKVLFDGTEQSLANWKGATMTGDGLLVQGVTSVPTFQSQTLHVEFRTPYMPHARGQGRGNSGLYLQGRYEVQMLDSFGLAGKNNECGGIYSIKDPDVNMCFPPLAWQTYDVEYTAARYDADGKKTANAKMTVRHNGVVVHQGVELPKSTTAAPVKESPEPGPVYLQNHGNPVRYRNIWVVAKE